jgi:hypothetical protein
VRRLLTCVLVVLCLGAPACGGDDDTDNFSEPYNAAIRRLDQASQKVIALAPSRKRESSRAIARQLDQFADVLAATRAELSGLEPPKSATRQFDALVAALDESVTAGHRAAAAARQIQPGRQRRALAQLRDAAVEVGNAQDALGRAVQGAGS